ncbi:MAG: HYR domain-containing protein, partial [Flavobacteriales bacterium]|nr:HYR domain-containing protein [Flavobacteriales bacterium]
TVTDNNGNVSTTTAVITVEDNVAPVALANNITVQLDANGQASITASDIDNGSNDVCGIASLEANNAFDCSNVGDNTVTLTVTDNNGNVSTETAIVTVQDVTAPVVVCSQDIIVENDSSFCGAVVTYVATSTDNCSSILTYTHLSGDYYPVGLTTVTVTATDPSGNTDVCSFNITVLDTENPTAICKPVVITVDSTGSASIIADDIDGGSTDNCAIAYIGASQTDYHCPDFGMHDITLTVTDIYDNSSTCETTVTLLKGDYNILSCPVYACSTCKDGEAEMCSEKNIKGMGGAPDQVVWETKCVKAKDLDKRLNAGWVEGACFGQPSGVLFCNSGGMGDPDVECVKWKDAEDNLEDKDMSLGQCEPANDCGCKKGLVELVLRYNYGSGHNITIDKGDIVDNENSTYTITNISGKGGKLDKKIKLIGLNGVESALTTDCSKPVNPGSMFGEFTVVSYIDKSGNSCPGEYIDIPVDETCDCVMGLAELVVSHINGPFENVTTNGGTIVDNEDGTYTIEGKGKKGLPKDLIINDGFGSTAINTSCKEPLVIGEMLGSFTLVSFVDKNGNECSLGGFVKSIDATEKTKTTAAIEEGVMSAYPNPTYDLVTIKTDISSPSGVMFIYSITGTLMLTINNPRTIEVIDMSDMASGLYKVVYMSGEDVRTVSVIRL